MRKTNKMLSIVIIVLNMLGIGCLVYFTAVFLGHDTSVPNPDAMLPIQRWDGAGVALTVGLLPLGIANYLGYKFIPLNNGRIRKLWFAPVFTCVAVVACYLFLSVFVY